MRTKILFARGKLTAALGILLTLSLFLFNSSFALATIIDDFNDGEFTNNPTWNLLNGDDSPGNASAVDGYVRFQRDAPPGNGGSISLTYDTEIYLNDLTSILFDVNPVFRNVVEGAGFQNGEYPINVRLYLEDENNSLKTLQFSYNYGGAGSDLTTPDFIRIANTNALQNTWLRDEEFIIRNYFPNAVEINSIQLFANGWDFEGLLDNVRISNAAPVPEPATMLLLGTGFVGLVGAGRKKFFKK